MASVEMVTTRLNSDIASNTYLNISGVVGIGGKNEKNDVMLVKALLFLNERNKDVSDAKYWGSSRIDLIDIPEISGILDPKTIQDIYDFQRRNASLLLSIDRRIDPANYRNRVINLSFGSKFMTIMLLNKQAYHAPIYLGVGDLQQAVKKIVPSIVFN